MFEHWEPKLTYDIVRVRTGVFLLRCRCGFITEHASGVLAVNVLLDRIQLREARRMQKLAKHSQTIITRKTKARRLGEENAKDRKD